MKYKTLSDYMPIIKDREAGLTYQEIADKLGVTHQRAQQIVKKGMRLRASRKTDPFHGLSARAVDAFAKLGLKSKEDVRKAVLSSQLHPVAGIRNYRWLTHNQVLVWLKMKPLPLYGNGVSGRDFIVCPKCGHQF